MVTDVTRRAKPVDFARFKLKKHVEDSLNTARGLADGQPISARHALMGAIAVSRTATASEAFQKLASLLSLKDLGEPQAEQQSDADLGALLLNPSLASSYSIAEPYFREGTVVWGRDYVTFALLALDPSLNRIAEEAGSSIGTLRDEWFNFVASSDQHRDLDSWAGWWHDAGVPLPHQRSLSPTGKALLLTWDPARGSFNPENVRQRVAKEGTAIVNWSVGHREVSAGDGAFFMRHGEDRPGLIGSGQIASDAVEGPHWDPDKPEGSTEFYAPVRLDAIQEFPLVPLPDLIDQTGEEKLWTTHGSGLPISEELAEKLEVVWRVARSDRDEPTPLAWVETDAIPVMGDLGEYQPSEHDSLDAATQARIFATLLVAKEVRPPFALGLLGDWGVGKTFFMRLMQETVASIAGKGAQADGSSNSVARAAQIEFNAWHYVDTNLWASLASHIFDGLSNELRGPDENVDEIRRSLRRVIRSSQREQKEAAAAIDAAQEERQTAAKELENIQAERALVAADYDSRRLKRVWQAVLAVKPDPGNEDQTNWPDIPELKQKAEHTAERLGITQAIDSAEEALRVYNSMRELTQRGTGLTTAFAAAFTGSRAWISGGVIVALLALVVAWPWILEQIEGALGVVEGTVTELLSPLMQLSTVVGAAAVWATKSLRSIASAIGYLEEILAEVREPRIDPPKASVEEERLREQVEKFDAEITTEQRRIEEADRQISAAQAEIQRINAGGLVYDFLEGRVRDSRYLDRLGLISVIRQDFEELGVLLRDWRKHGASTDDDGRPSPDDSWEAMPIQRIILYIDDLDRCPPKRVVEVLQAVHLILAFDLFVVVVAVDPRWLERSLNEAYNPVVQDGNSAKEPIHQFSAHNYLEKIFQIPFSLPVMDEPGYRKLVGDITATPRKLAGRADETRSDETGAGLTPATSEREGSPEDEEVETDSATRQAGERQIVGDRQGLKPQTRERDEEEQRKREQEEAGKRIEAMLLRDYEDQFIAALYCFIDTPRLAKRFVNIYRLLRVRAATLGEDFSKFIEREHGEYRSVLLLLAISVGRANVAPEILEDLHKASGKGFRTWIKGKSRQYEKERSQLSDERIAQSGNIEATDRERRLAELRDDSLEIHECVGTVIQALNELGGPSFDDHLPNYRNWAREVGRYAFRWHLKARAQSDTRAPTSRLSSVS